MLNVNKIYFILGRHENEADGIAAAFEIKKLLKGLKKLKVIVLFEEGGTKLEPFETIWFDQIYDNMQLGSKELLFNSPAYLYKIKRENDFESFKKVYEFRSIVKKLMFVDNQFKITKFIFEGSPVSINPLAKSFSAPLFSLVKKRNFIPMQEAVSLEDSWKRFLKSDPLNEGKFNSERDIKLVTQLESIRAENPNCVLIVVRGKGHKDTLRDYLKKKQIDYEFIFYKRLNLLEKLLDRLL